MAEQAGDFPADFVWGAATASFQVEGALEAVSYTHLTLPTILRV